MERELWEGLMLARVGQSRADSKIRGSDSRGRQWRCDCDGKLGWLRSM